MQSDVLGYLQQFIKHLKKMTIIGWGNCSLTYSFMPPCVCSAGFTTLGLNLKWRLC